ncbi:oxidative damage protection protein [Fangia hongkongensis]|uniref:oxidative damage protection protein n=1 Tax=Fangia hongkongensis TaxID=270495 RepID=UPI00036951AC|nr:oxidative damage protection protein [Fangia hongkongensis]MBK2123642.1 oxidative damage protection protein [Fangia hongkongensis]
MATVFCNKLQKEGAKLAFQPIPGKLGKRILGEISQEAWSKWLEHQTILINEYRLNLLEPEAKQFLMTEMEKFLFGEGSEKPDAYSKPE